MASGLSGAYSEVVHRLVGEVLNTDIENAIILPLPVEAKTAKGHRFNPLPAIPRDVQCMGNGPRGVGIADVASDIVEEVHNTESENATILHQQTVAESVKGRTANHGAAIHALVVLMVAGRPGVPTAVVALPADLEADRQDIAPAPIHLLPVADEDAQVIPGRLEDARVESLVHK